MDVAEEIGERWSGIRCRRAEVVYPYVWELDDPAVEGRHDMRQQMRCLYFVIFSCVERSQNEVYVVEGVEIVI